MATKYTREDRWERRTSPPQGGFFARMPPKRRLLVIYLGILIFTLFGILASRFGAITEFSSQTPQRGIGTVIAKELREGPEEPLQILTIRMSQETRKEIDAEVPVEPEQWEAFTPGDRIGILYERSRWSGDIRILEVGIAPLE